jgi:hypothetical protein
VDNVADQLEHLEIRLDVFNTQLGAMRKDIATIEQRNNRLQLEARNHAALLGHLNTFLDTLRLPPSVHAALTDGARPSPRADYCTTPNAGVCAFSCRCVHACRSESEV